MLLRDRINAHPAFAIVALFDLALGFWKGPTVDLASKNKNM
jgi:hypothetical protein